MEKPNILFILVDDMGYGDFSRFNGGLSSTAVLDGLIDDSLCFTQQYTASPVCNPSRAALMTGRYPHRTGSVDTLEWRGLERLALRETTLADVLSSAGYVTGLVGKWHLGAYDPRYHPNSRGFDESVCFRGGMHDYHRWRIECNRRVMRADGRYLTDVWTEEAVDFIRRHRRDPFFLHVTYNAPHTPLQAPEEEVRPFVESGRFTRGVSILYGMLRRMDRGVGRILEVLRECGLEENTVVLFSSDNGPQFGGRGEERLDRFNCGFNGAKGLVYEGGIRVPMILRWPAGGFAAGRKVDAMVHFCDWYPTLLAVAEVPVPEDNLPLDGVDLMPVLGGEAAAEEKRFWQWNRYTPRVTTNAAVRHGAWKLVRPAMCENMGITREDEHWLRVSMYGPEHFITQGLITDPEPEREVPPAPPPELYNIEEDPLEKHDLADREPERVRKLLRELESWFEEVEAERASIAEHAG